MHMFILFSGKNDQIVLVVTAYEPRGLGKS
jgi:hypothetical protein